MVIRKLLWLMLVLCIEFADAQSYKYFIHLTDKTSSAFDITRPEEFLSPRAIERRSRQNIPVTVIDLPVSPEYADGIAATGARIRSRSRWLNGVLAECDSATLDAVNNLSYVKDIDCVNRNAKAKKAKKSQQGIPLNMQKQMLRVSGFDYGSAGNQVELMHADHLHDNGYTGSGLVIAVLDAGFWEVNVLSAFDNVNADGRILGTWDFVANEPDVYADATHGMAVLSTIASNLPGQFVGTAPHASFYLLRSEDAGSENIIEEYNWAAAAEYADSAGADIISSSLGYTVFDDSTMSHTYADMNGNTAPVTMAADIAASRGILVVNSAGNSGNGTWYYIGAPADGDSVLAVGAVDSLGNYASFSSHGPSSDGDVKPNVMAKGAQTTIIDFFGNVVTGNGTSFACPVLSGAAACLWQAHPAKTNMEIFDAIQRSANYYHAPNDSFGHGIPDFRIADFILSTGGVGGFTGDELISVYPNPVSDHLNIQYFSSTAQEALIEVTGMVGQVIASQKVQLEGGFVNRVTVDLPADISGGIYMVTVKTKSRSYLRKVMKL